jgi:hypothetical protein
MFFFRHPKGVVDPRAVAMLVVQQKATQALSRTLLIVERKESTPAAPQPPAADPA